ncbi:MAG: ABC transporter permease [Lachnospirales bacterium]
MNNKSKYFKKYWQLYAMMLLPIIYFIVFKYIPLFGNILAFRKYSPGGSPFGTEWRDFFYFKMFLTDPNFIRAFKNTLVISLLNIIVNFPIPIIFAILLNELKNVHFKKFVQTVSYMPRFISTVVVVSILTDLLSPSSGIVNMLLTRHFGIEPIYFMNDPAYTRFIYIFTETWQFTGWTAIIYLAAITGISEELFEAARIDGANKFQEMKYITIPCLLPTIMVMLILNIGRLLSVGFEKVLLLYTPQNAAVIDVIDTFVYRIGMQEQNYSYATAVGLFGGIIGLILVSSANRFSRKFTGESIY